MANNLRDLEGLTGGQPTGAPDFPDSSGTSVNPGAGSLVLTGYAPGVAASANVLPGVGAAAFNGLAPSIIFGNTILPGVGNVEFEGYAPSIGGNVSVLPGVGLLAFGGLAPSIVFGTQVSPGVGSASFDGYAPAVAFGNSLFPLAGNSIVTGYAPSISGYGVPLVPSRYGLLAPAWRFGLLAPAWRFGLLAPAWRFGLLIPGDVVLPYVGDLRWSLAPGVPQTCWIDFGNALPVGVTLSSPSEGVEVYTGSDPDPDDIVLSGPTVGTVATALGGTGFTDTAVLIQLQGDVPNTTYAVRLRAARSDGTDVADGVMRVTVGPQEP